MSDTTITTKGQMTLPADIRKHLDLHQGDRLTCFIDEGRIVMVPQKRPIRELKGMIKIDRSLSLEEMDEAIDGI
ncbi:MAG: AbrB/MazE/SpoVT family DNA-binding domain-containing protein [Verrucomicrobiota bacterium JB022]|nr:AbrB/MazE/SpoVT family DNA-binding domain-containing protein [Verrucomicrobiota bacterium JB022]